MGEHSGPVKLLQCLLEGLLVLHDFLAPYLLQRGNDLRFHVPASAHCLVLSFIQVVFQTGRIRGVRSAPHREIAWLALGSITPRRYAALAPCPAANRINLGSASILKSSQAMRINSR